MLLAADVIRANLNYIVSQRILPDIFHMLLS